MMDLEDTMTTLTISDSPGRQLGMRAQQTTLVVDVLLKIHKDINLALVSNMVMPVTTTLHGFSAFSNPREGAHE